MEKEISRRTLLKGGGAGLTGLTVLRVAGPAQLFGQADEEVIPWLDQPPPNPVPQIVGKLLKWEELDSWRIPPDRFFWVAHFGLPRRELLDETTWHVDISGLVARPRSLSMADIKARPRAEVDFTLECSGNTGTPESFFIGGIGNGRWGGSRLAPILEQADILDRAQEVIFYGVDSGKLTIRDNVGVLSGGRTGTVEPDPGGGLDLTITEQFARSMSIEEALSPDNLLCYELNGVPLPLENGFPVRLIAPGWYGVANVKWLTRIEVVGRRYAGQYMARDYVSIREERQNGQTVWTFSTVSRDRLKSAPAKVTRQNGRYFIMGAAWGAPVAAVHVRIDSGDWTPATLDNREPTDSDAAQQSKGYAWRFWTLNWGRPISGEHRITSRAIDIYGNIQPAPDDPFVASRRTYWENNGHITRRVLIS
jgi:DMSO/TMAO reductase YedYZ molybdopterin-dependent catalytic subunit